MTNQGYFSVLRWRADVTRDEARNVAVLLVDTSGELGGMRSAPVSSVSPRLHEQGIVDSVLVELQRQFSAEHKPTVGMLDELTASLSHSLYLTPPKPTALPDVDLVLTALYKAYVSPRGGGSKVLTKGKLLDQVVARIRGGGLNVRRGNYLGDFLFDALVETTAKPTAVEVLSFATTAQKWVPTEHDAGHYLFALERVAVPGIAVVERPTDASHPNARDSYDRVRRWFDTAGVPAVAADGITEALAAV